MEYNNRTYVVREMGASSIGAYCNKEKVAYEKSRRQSNNSSSNQEELNQLCQDDDEMITLKEQNHLNKMKCEYI